MNSSTLSFCPVHLIEKAHICLRAPGLHLDPGGLCKTESSLQKNVKSWGLIDQEAKIRGVWASS